jgi:hypothetical protein
MRAVEADRFETQIYYVDMIDVFHTIDYEITPAANDWVVVKYRDGPGLAIEPFYGQSFFGVARILQYCQLTHSEQGALRSLPVIPD